jgi:hypothetical protein
MANNDDIENLFRNLPKAPAFSELERKRQEKLIRSYVADMAKDEALKQNSPLKRFQSQFSLAAGFIVLIAGVSFAVGQGLFESKNELVISMPTPENQSLDSEGSESQIPEDSESAKPSKPNEPSNSNQDGIIEFESDGTSQSDFDLYINNTGLDYVSDTQKIKNIIKLSTTPLSISDLPQSFGKCAVELGINKNLLGIDKAKYDGTSILAFYYGSSRAASSIWIIEKPCKRVVEIK